MLLGVPIFAVIKTLVSEFIDKKLKKKNMPVTTCAYFTGGYVEPLAVEAIVDASTFDDNDEEDDDDDYDEPENSSSFMKNIKEIANKVAKKFKK